MVYSLRIRNFILPMLFYAATCLVVCFFMYSAYHGSRGIMAKRDYKLKISNLQSQLDALKTEHNRWQVRVNLVQPTSFDPDIVEERARLILNNAHKNDVIILFDK